MNGFQGDFLRGALDVAPDGVVICERRPDGWKFVTIGGSRGRFRGYIHRNFVPDTVC